jgi:hypothetical protein
MVELIPICAYTRLKTGSQAVIRFDGLAEENVKSRAGSGYLFPMIALWNHSDRAKAFILQCKLVGGGPQHVAPNGSRRRVLAISEQVPSTKS